MKNTVLILLLLSAAFGGPVEEIRKLYKEVQKGIDSRNYYISELSVNSSDDTGFPAVGTYKKLFTFYWSNSEEQNRLVKISISSHYSATAATEEFLFDRKGELLFYYISGGYDEVERRYYFDGMRVIRTIINDALSDNPTDEQIKMGKKIQQRASDYTAAFSYTHR